MTIAAVRLNHAVLFVSDLERSLRFWTGAFGMEVVARERRADAAFPLTVWTADQAIDAVAAAAAVTDSRYASFGFRLPEGPGAPVRARDPPG